MARGFRCPGPDGAIQLGTSGKHGGVVDEVSGMQVDRNMEVLHLLPEREIHVRIQIVPVGLPVDKRSLEPKLLHSTLKFRGRRGGILHGKMGEASISLRSL